MSDFHLPQCKQHKKPFWQILLSARWQFKKMLETGTWVREQYVGGTLSALSLFHLFLPKAIISLKALFLLIRHKQMFTTEISESLSSRGWQGPLDLEKILTAFQEQFLLYLCYDWGEAQWLTAPWTFILSLLEGRSDICSSETSPSHHDSTAMPCESYSLDLLQSWYPSIRRTSPHILPRESATFGETNLVCSLVGDWIFSSLLGLEMNCFYLKYFLFCFSPKLQLSVATKSFSKPTISQKKMW